MDSLHSEQHKKSKKHLAIILNHPPTSTLLEGMMAQEWDEYTQILISSAVKLKHVYDELLWSKNPSAGAYTTRLGYASLLTEDVRRVVMAFNMDDERCSKG